jgi:hypothetical protein
MRKERKYRKPPVIEAPRKIYFAGSILMWDDILYRHVVSTEAPPLRAVGLSATDSGKK